ncbi:MAG: 30S ribosomal protein S20 [Bacillota bacterium]
MPKSRSAVKRVRTSEERRLRNKRVKSRIKSSIRKFMETLKGGDEEEIELQLRQAVSNIDRGVSKGVIHRNQAARKKSQLYRALQEREVTT